MHCGVEVTESSTNKQHHVKGLRAGVEGDCAPGRRELDDVDLQSEQSDIALHATVRRT